MPNALSESLSIVQDRVMIFECGNDDSWRDPDPRSLPRISFTSWVIRFIDRDLMHEIDLLINIYFHHQKEPFNSRVTPHRLIEFSNYLLLLNHPIEKSLLKIKILSPSYRLP